MKGFEQTNNETTFKFKILKNGGFPKFQIELFRKSICYFKSSEILISQTAIDEMTRLFKNGNPFLNVSRFEFRDVYNSFLIFLKGETTVIGSTYNHISGKREDLEFKDIDKRNFLSYLETLNL